MRKERGPRTEIKEILRGISGPRERVPTATVELSAISRPGARAVARRRGPMVGELEEGMGAGRSGGLDFGLGGGTFF
jgi:hypothetical protein